jgi:hypothetical protein
MIYAWQSRKADGVYIRLKLCIKQEESNRKSNQGPQIRNGHANQLLDL